MRHLITLDDLSNFEIEQIFRLADQMRTQLATWSGFCKGKLLATLFYEPSTRTRLSFESAIGRLDGRSLGFADPSAASVSKGETIADTARMVTNYSDLIVVRHNWAGAAHVMARYSNVPVINGGDGQPSASHAGTHRPVHNPPAERADRRTDGWYLRRPAIWARSAFAGTRRCTIRRETPPYFARWISDAQMGFYPLETSLRSGAA